MVLAREINHIYISYSEIAFNNQLGNESMKRPIIIATLSAFVAIIVLAGTAGPITAAMMSSPGAVVPPGLSLDAPIIIVSDANFAIQEVAPGSGIDLADKSLASFSLTFKTADFGSITGVVMDQNGNLVSGAEVKLRSSGVLVGNVTTGSDGRFTINAPAGAYELTISKAGMLEKTVSATISTGQTVDLGDQTLEPDKTLAYIVIMVVIVIGAVALAVWVPRRKK